MNQYGQTGGQGKADPQRHERHHPHHGLAGLSRLGILGGFLVLDALVVGDDGIVGLLADPHLEHLKAGGQAGNQESTDVSPVPDPGGTENVELGWHPG